MTGRLLTLAMGAALAAGAAQAQTTYPKNDYAKPDAWLCWPGKSGDACAIDLTTTVISADGSSKVEAFKADPKAPVDCFYVYPTVSNDPGVVSDMNAGPEELNVVKQQLARFGAKCRIFAPIYRQFTLTALRSMTLGQPIPGATDPAVRQVGFNDVVEAWNYYLAHENKGRGVVLIGHSQGSGVLQRLIPAEIEGKPVQKQLISALILGSNLGVETGKDTGVFKTIPLCKSPTQTGCAISYVTFRAEAPPPANTRFGRVTNPSGMTAACTNPAALGGGPAPLKAYLSNGMNIASSSNPTPEWVKGKPNPTTPFVAVPGLITGQCVSKDGFSYLEAKVNADPADPRTDIISGDVTGPGGVIAKDWGLHLIDVNIAMGDLVDVVGQQSKAYLAKKK
ncbi:MAG: lysophospholipase [Phenylobacterium zucineum]|nr:MAG: lysophospholipase [Phenylobacterium zucineum]